jgi:hypothetical protein
MTKASRPTSVAHLALFYITLGALIIVWCAAWYWWYGPATTRGYFWLAGFAMSGVVLLIIGLTLGRIGRSARKAEIAPEEPDEPAAVIPPQPVPPTYVLPPVQTPAPPASPTNAPPAVTVPPAVPPPAAPSPNANTYAAR